MLVISESLDLSVRHEEFELSAQDHDAEPPAALLASMIPPIDP